MRAPLRGCQEQTSASASLASLCPQWVEFGHCTTLLPSYSHPMRCLLALSAACFAPGSGSTATAPPTVTREYLISAYATVLKYWDKDGDGRLSRTEDAAMVDESFGRLAQEGSDDRTKADLEKHRQEILAFDVSQDINGDAYLTLDELLRTPLAHFECADKDHDGKLSDDEIKGMSQCPSVSLQNYAPTR